MLIDLVTKKSRTPSTLKMYYELNYASKIQPYVKKALAAETFETPGARLVKINEITQQFYEEENEDVKQDIAKRIEEIKQNEDNDNDFLDRTPELYLRFALLVVNSDI